MAKKRRSRQIRPAFGSGISLNNKVLIIFILIVLSGAVIVGVAFSIVSGLVEDSRTESQKMIMTAADEYLNTEIENIVTVSKNVYASDEVYEFLNKRYQSTVDYFDSYYDFSKSRFLVNTETGAVKEFKIYTANSTVMNGGNIGKLELVEDEDWYIRYTELERDMIIYCSRDGKNLSLIRKLDYQNVRTGEAVLKIDFNPANLQNSFKNMYFDGKVYVSCGGTLLYSNQKELSLPDSETLDSYIRKSRNFYTCDIDYYVLANRKTITSVPSVRISLCLFLLIVCFIVAITLIITDFKNRTMEVCRLCTDKKKITADSTRINMGKDEIAVLYKDVSNTITDLRRLDDERKDLKKYIEEYKLRTNDVILAALSFEMRKQFNIESAAEADDPVTLDEELLLMSRMLDRLKESELFKYSLLSDTTSSVKNVIPYSLSSVALHVAQYGGVGKDVEIDVREHNGCYSIRFYKSETAFSSSDILRLRAIFEPYSAKSLPSFEAEDIFNCYVRLSRYYLDNITLNINSKEVIDFEFIITSQDR